MAAYARTKGLIVSLKNSGAWVDLVDPDFFQIESCFDYKTSKGEPECMLYVGRGKPVFNIQYKSFDKIKSMPGLFTIKKKQMNGEEL